uniref:DnaJ homolog subfamily B member 9 n=1 Tax=Romanomermis culicivorax TaxID=13658 RepID=A0A915KPW5_ROMCU
MLMLSTHFVVTTLCAKSAANPNAKDFYERLGLKKGATDGEIKRSFKKLALEYHPDKNKDPNAQEEFTRIAEAYETLKDPKKRKDYDRGGFNDFFGGEHFDFNFGSFFKEFDRPFLTLATILFKLRLMAWILGRFLALVKCTVKYLIKIFTPMVSNIVQPLLGKLEIPLKPVLPALKFLFHPIVVCLKVLFNIIAFLYRHSAKIFWAIIAIFIVTVSIAVCIIYYYADDLETWLKQYIETQKKKQHYDFDFDDYFKDDEEL